MTDLTIGQLAHQIGVNPRTVRYYESIGLMPEPHRSPAGYRLYDDVAQRRLELVRVVRGIGLPLKEVARVVDAALAGSCDELRGVLVERIDPRLHAVDQQIAEMRDYQRGLQAMRARLVRAAEHDAADPVGTCMECACLNGRDATAALDLPVVLPRTVASTSLRTLR